MARNISVKVSTAKVIKALEDKIASAQKATVTNEKKRKDYEKVEKSAEPPNAKITALVCKGRKRP